MDSEQAFQAVRTKLGPRWTLARVSSRLEPGVSEGSPTLRRISVDLERSDLDPGRNYWGGGIAVYHGEGATLEEALETAFGLKGVQEDEGLIGNGDRLRIAEQPLAEIP